MSDHLLPLNVNTWFVVERIVCETKSKTGDIILASTFAENVHVTSALDIMFSVSAMFNPLLFLTIFCVRCSGAFEQ